LPSAPERHIPIGDDVRLLVCGGGGCLHHQEFFAVTGDVIPGCAIAGVTYGQLKERPGSAGFQRRAGRLNVDGHHGAVRGHIEELSPIPSPVG